MTAVDELQPTENQLMKNDLPSNCYISFFSDFDIPYNIVQAAEVISDDDEPIDGD